MTPSNKLRGRPRTTNFEIDAAVLQAWKAIQGTGISRQEFATQRQMSVEELERLLQRASKRKA